MPSETIEQIREAVNRRIKVSEEAATHYAEARGAASVNQALMNYHHGCVGALRCVLEDLDALEADAKERE